MMMIQQHENEGSCDTERPLVFMDSYKFRCMYDKYVRLDSHDERVRLLFDLCNTDNFKNEVNTMRPQCVIDYIYYTRLLFAPQWPVKVRDTKRNDYGQLVYFALECGMPLSSSLTSSEGAASEGGGKGESIWTDRVDVTLSVMADHAGRTSIQKLALGISSSSSKRYKWIDALRDWYFDCFDRFKFDSFEWHILKENQQDNTQCLGTQVDMTLSFTSSEGRNVRCELSGTYVIGPHVFAEALQDPFHVFDTTTSSECMWKTMALYQDKKAAVRKRRNVMQNTCDYPSLFWSTDDDDEEGGGEDDCSEKV